MMWKKVVLAATVLIAVIFTIISVNPSGVQVIEFSEKASIRTTETMTVPFLKDISLTGFSVSGSWEGSGYAEVWLVGEGRKYLVMDTLDLPKTIELSSFGTSFENVCIDSCKMPVLKPETLVLVVSGPGVLSIDSLHFVAPATATGLSLCPNCKRVTQSENPDHSLLAVVFLLVLAVFGSHLVGHICTGDRTKRILMGAFLVGFISLGILFGVSVAAPTTAIAVTTKKAASVFAAFGMLLLVAAIAVEVLVKNKEEVISKPDVWKDLEAAEEEWEKKK